MNQTQLTIIELEILMQNKPLFSASIPCQMTLIAFFTFIGMAHLDVNAATNTAGRKLAEATIQSNDAKQEEEEKEEQEKEAKKTDFKNRLSARRISEYASFDRALFDKSFDVGYAMSYSQADSFFSQRGLSHGLFLSTGLGKLSGISLSMDRSKLSTYDTLGGRPELVDSTRTSSGSVGLNRLLLPETLLLPQLVASVDFGSGKSEGIGFKTRGVGFSTSRTLESASLFGTLQFQQSRQDGADWQSFRTLGVSYFLTINHRLAAGLGYSLAKAEDGLSVPSTSASLVYRLFPEWVVRGTASRVSGAEESNTVGVDLTYTFQP
jgi:hypothetical protein